MPAARAVWMMRTQSAWSRLPQAPGIMAPRQYCDTDTPVRPRIRCSMGPVCPSDATEAARRRPRHQTKFVRLRRPHPTGLQTLRALGGLELHPLALGQLAVARHLD